MDHGLSKAAIAWKAEWVKKRKPVCESSVSLSRSLYDDIWEKIDQYGWNKLVSKQAGYDAQLVVDFYASLVDYDEDTGSMPFKGKILRIGSREINEFFNLEDFEPQTEDHIPGDESDYTRSELDLLCGRNFKLIHGKNSIERRFLTRYARIWMSIVHGNLMPCKSHVELRLGRGKLLASILAGKRINIGRVIWKDLHKHRQDYKSGFIYACTITSICRAQGITNLPISWLVFDGKIMDDRAARAIDKTYLESDARDGREAEEVVRRDAEEEGEEVQPEEQILERSLEEQMEAMKDEIKLKAKRRFDGISLRLRESNNFMREQIRVLKERIEATARPRGSNSSRGQERLIEDSSRDIRGYKDESCMKIEDVINEEHAWHRGEFLALHMRLDAIQRQGDQLAEMDLREREYQERRRRRRHRQQHEPGA